MKTLHLFFARLRSKLALKRGKSGASLALVVTIGAALAIWVIGILPMMMGSGTTAISMEKEYSSYLNSKSAIEFVKSELEHIVETEPPYTFAVILDPNNPGQYAAVPKVNVGGAGTNPDYINFISDVDTGTDLDDVPNMSNQGDEVIAVCAVEQDEEDLNTYHMFIDTYDNGQKGMVYTASYTLFGTVKINPEAYQQMDALPLSDYILVDGILGGKFDKNGNLLDEPNIIWESSIERGASYWVYDSSSSDFDDLIAENMDFQEWLLPSDFDANAGDYTVVFKKTAQAAEAEEQSSQKDPIESDPITQGGALMPYPTTAEDTAKKNGATWFVAKDKTVYMSLDGQDVDVTQHFTVLYNGRIDAPQVSGSYRVTLNVKENVTLTSASGKVYNLLQINGLCHKEWVVTINDPVLVTDAIEISREWDWRKNEFVYYATITLKNTPDGIKFAVSDSDDTFDDLNWVNENTFPINNKNVYYFYAYRPFSFKNGIFTAEIPPTLIGTVGFKATDSVESGKSYAILDPTLKYYLSINDGEAICEDSGITSSNNFYISTKQLPVWNFQYKISLFSGGWYISRNNRYLTIKNGNVSLSESKQIMQIDKNGIYNSYNSYLTIADGEPYLSTKGRVKYIRLEYPNIVTPASSIAINNKHRDYNDSDVQSGTALFKHIKSSYKNIQISEFYLNGIPYYEYEDPISVGTYLMGGKVGNSYVKFGDLTVDPIEQSDALTLSATSVNGDDLKVKLEVDGWSSIDKRVHYFGYAPVVNGATGEYTWFATEQAKEYELRLLPGTYAFAAAEYIDGNYISRISNTVSLTIQWKDLHGITFEKDSFEYDLTPLSGTTFHVDWYALPKDGKGAYYFPPDRLTLVYGSYNDMGTLDPADDVLTWSEQYSDNVVVYGVCIANSDYESVPILLNAPMNTGKHNGHQNSAITAEQLYFMGDTCSIQTYGNDIQLTTDLLVIKNPMNVGQTGGTIHVYPYSEGTGKEDDSGKVLFFPMSDIKRGEELIFERYQFYIVEPGTNILNPKPGEFKLVQSSKGVKNTVTSGDNPKVIFCRAAENLFRKGLYPEIDLDIAYANKDQLHRILSSETLGWTQKGVLKGTNKNSDFSPYVVCALVNKVEGKVTGLANRIMIAAKSSPTSNDLSLPDRVEFTTRYLEIDATSVKQGAAKQPFMLYNLGQSQDFFTWLSDMLGLTNYISKTLQLDHERTTTYTFNDGSRTDAARVTRCDDGTNLFSNIISSDLMVTYTNQELAGFFGGLTSTVKTIDRYVTITGKPSDHALTISSFSSSTKLEMYANYIWIDDTDKEGTANDTYIDTIRFNYLDDWFTNGNSKVGIHINSQEYGYTAKDYLGLFQTNSGESYAGTIVYVGKPLKVEMQAYIYIPFIGYIKSGDLNEKNIQPGFYYVFAKPGGTNIVELATNLLEFPDGADRNEVLADNASGDKLPYKILEEELTKYSVYIDKETGKLSDAYVDTGIYGSDATAFGGFSGGNVQ